MSFLDICGGIIVGCVTLIALLMAVCVLVIMFKCARDWDK